MKIKLNKIEEQSGSVYELWGDLSPCQHPEGYSQLSIYSTYSGAKDPSIAWERAKLILSPDALANLKLLLASGHNES